MPVYLKELSGLIFCVVNTRGQWQSTVSVILSCFRVFSLRSKLVGNTDNTMKSDAKKLIKKNPNLVHSEMQKVVSHVQRIKDSWVLNTVLIEGCDVPFKYKRKEQYKSLKGARVNITYYPGKEDIAGMEFEVMVVVRIRQA